MTEAPGYCKIVEVLLNCRSHSPSQDLTSNMENMDDIVKKSLLFDFYGPLLTEHQRRIYEEVVFNDYSISEIAADEGISRQGVHDMIKRCDKALSEYEEKLGLVEKFARIRELAKNSTDPETAAKILEIL